MLILISISRGLLPKKTPSTESELKKISYFKEKNLPRYLSLLNKNLSYEEIVTYINIGLDKPYYTNVKKAKDLNSTTILVNKYNYLEKNYIPNNLETIKSKYANTNIKLTSEAKIAFEQMAEAASKESLTIIAMSAYRSYSYQETLYNNYVKKDGIAKADTYSARPGHSEHQTGLAVDVYNKTLSYTDFEKTNEFIWMQDNAYKYGFILRYPKNKANITGYQYESWHYRYVGKKISSYIHFNNITYDEYYIKFLDK